MRNRIFGAIGIIWGGGILLTTIMRGGPQGRGAYGAGEYGGLVFGALLLVAGLYTFFKPGPPKT